MCALSFHVKIHIKTEKRKSLVKIEAGEDQKNAPIPAPSSIVAGTIETNNSTYEIALVRIYSSQARSMLNN